MIEGLRVLPWFQDARRKDPTMLDCTTCQPDVNEQLRRDMACAYLERDPAQPAMSSFRFGGDEKTACATCPGYTTELPDVIDAARCFSLPPGLLALHLGGGDAPPALVEAIEVLGATVKTHEGWHARNPERD